MDWLDIPYCRPIVAISSVRQVWTWATSYKLSEISSLDKVGYLLLQLETISSIVSMFFMKLAILVFVPLEGFGLDFPKLFIF